MFFIFNFGLLTVFLFSLLLTFNFGLLILKYLLSNIYFSESIFLFFLKEKDKARRLDKVIR